LRTAIKDQADPSSFKRGLQY